MMHVCAHILRKGSSKYTFSEPFMCEAEIWELLKNIYYSLHRYILKIWKSRENLSSFREFLNLKQKKMFFLNRWTFLKNFFISPLLTFFSNFYSFFQFSIFCIFWLFDFFLQVLFSFWLFYNLFYNICGLRFFSSLREEH